MRWIHRGAVLAIALCLPSLSGCSEEPSDTISATNENPQAGLDAIKKLQGNLPSGKEAAQGKYTAPSEKSETPETPEKPPEKPAEK